MRGLSVIQEMNSKIDSVFPRMRGLSGHATSERPKHPVFPPLAGVIGRPGAQENWLNSIPPAYGGYRFPALRRWWSPRIPPACGGYWPVRILRNRCRAYSPRLRGLSGWISVSWSAAAVFHPCAGVIGSGLLFPAVD